VQRKNKGEIMKTYKVLVQLSCEVEVEVNRMADHTAPPSAAEIGEVLGGAEDRLKLIAEQIYQGAGLYCDSAIEARVLEVEDISE
jgi:hypothetical protein